MPLKHISFVILSSSAALYSLSVWNAVFSACPFKTETLTSLAFKTFYVHKNLYKTLKEGKRRKTL